MKNLEKKRALITGAATVLGYAAGLECAELGAKLVLFDLDGDKLADASASLGQRHREAEVVTVVGDAAREADVVRWQRSSPSS